MSDYSTKISVLKRSILNFTDKISAGMSRPFRKFAADMCYGAMASQNCILSEIAQVLQEDTKKINTIERLARNLSKKIPEAVEDNYLNIVKHYLPDNTVVHIDNSDVVKPSGLAFEGISRVRDGSKSTAEKCVMGNGYYVTEAVALTNDNHPVSVFPKFGPQNLLSLSLAVNSSIQRKSSTLVRRSSVILPVLWIVVMITMTFFACWTNWNRITWSASN